MKTLGRLAQTTEQRRVQVRSFACVNPDHHLAAARRDDMRLRDRRLPIWGASIPQHDYCTTPAPEGEPRLFHGRPAFCPLGKLAEDHEWIETNAPRARRLAPD